MSVNHIHFTTIIFRTISLMFDEMKVCEGLVFKQDEGLLTWETIIIALG